MFNSAGNKGDEGTSGGDSKNFMWVGACIMPQDKPTMASYSSVGKHFEDIDFSAFMTHSKWYIDYYYKR